MIRHNTRSELNRLLHARNESPDQAAEIDAAIQRAFAETHAILVLDLSGFSRLTMRYGVIHFLAMIYRLGAIALPITEQHQGRLVKQDADNLFVVFPAVDLAVCAAVNLLETFSKANAETPDYLDLYASIGIGYGEVLMVGQEDMYGNEMNLASKLGEDMARPGEIMVTEAAFNQLHPRPEGWEKLDVSISGLQIKAYRRSLLPHVL